MEEQSGGIPAAPGKSAGPLEWVLRCGGGDGSMIAVRAPLTFLIDQPRRNGPGDPATLYVRHAEVGMIFEEQGTGDSVKRTAEEFDYGALRARTLQDAEAAAKAARAAADDAETQLRAARRLPPDPAGGATAKLVRIQVQQITLVDEINPELTGAVLCTSAGDDDYDLKEARRAAGPKGWTDRIDWVGGIADETGYDGGYADDGADAE